MTFKAVLVLFALWSSLTSYGATAQSVSYSNFTTEAALASFLDSISTTLANFAGNLVQSLVDNRTIDQEVTFWCGKRGYSQLQQTFVNDSAIASKLDLTKPIAFITHGWIDAANASWVQEMAGNYSKYVDSNVCAVDWSHYSHYVYAIAAKRNTVLVGAYLVTFMKFLSSNGITPSKMTLIGHSLGAHISSYACKAFNGQVKELYGLDPAGPLFTMPIDVGTTKRITSTDAVYVQVIATSRGLLGIDFSVGQQNFYPNGGYHPQPSCLLPMLTYSSSLMPLACSHDHSHQLFTIALNPAIKYVGKMCGSYTSYVLGLCAFKSTDVLGIYANKSKGDFYFMQSIFYPFT